MTAPVVIDTNIVIAGLLTGRGDSATCRILDGMLGAAFPYALSEALLTEYRVVLARPRVRAIHGLSDKDIDTLLVELTRHAIVLTPAPSGLRAPDAEDQHLWDLLASHGTLRLVTGDFRLLGDKALAGQVMSAAAFAATLG